MALMRFLVIILICWESRMVKQYLLPLSLFCLSLVANAAPKEIIFWHSMAGQLGEEVVRLSNQFNASQEGYRVKPVYKGDYMESLTSFAAAFRAKHPPHLLQVSEVGTSVMRSPIGIIKPVEDLMREQGMDIEKQRFYPAVLSNYSSNNLLLAMPFNVSVPVLFYNADVLAKFGVSRESFPKTWDELESLAKHLRDKGYSCTYTTAYPAWILLESYQAIQGLRGAKADSVDNPQKDVLAHINRMRRWQLQHYFVYGGRGDDATVLFTSGICPIFSQSSGGYAALSELVPFHLGVAPMPLDSANHMTRHNNVIGGAALWVVAGQPRDIERGVALFLAFLSQPLIQHTWYEHTGYLPLDKRSLDSSFNNSGSYILDIAKLDLNHANDGSFSSQSGAENQIRVINDQMLEAIFSGMMSSEEAMSRALSRIQHVSQRFKKNTGMF